MPELTELVADKKVMEEWINLMLRGSAIDPTGLEVIAVVDGKIVYSVANKKSKSRLIVTASDIIVEQGKNSFLLHESGYNGTEFMAFLDNYHKEQNQRNS